MNLEECELLADSKYRAYIAQVEKTLRNFESTSEWADLIAALGKLNKVLSAHVKYPVIPKRVTIGKRLAQCLHPALPSGVHLKALETYDIIFKCIGTPRLASDLFTYSAGLFPLLAHAALNVKPALLLLYETHFVPLGKHIKPALSGLLLGLLPGLEEGSESFDRTVALLEEFCEAAEPTYFYACVWECVLSSSAVRLAAINYVLLHFSRKQSMEDQIHFMGSNVDLLVEALVLSMQDQSVLVQRSALELLLVAFPMHNSQLTRPDMIKLCSAAVKVVLRRDMSLNRRLYAWLLGTDSGGNPLPSRADTISTCSEPEMDYFFFFSREILVAGIKICINETRESAIPSGGKPLGHLRPFRILISLLDRAEVGCSVLEDIMIDVFRCMYRECAVLSSSTVQNGDASVTSLGRKKDGKTRREDRLMLVEVVKTANLLFGAFEPHYMWDFIGRTFELACQEAGTSRKAKCYTEEKNICINELCILVDFLLDKVSLEVYTETQTEYLPELLRTITQSLCVSCINLRDSEMKNSLQLCSKILSRVLPSMAPVGGYEIEGSPFRHKPEPIEEKEEEEEEIEDDCEDNLVPPPSQLPRQSSTPDNMECVRRVNLTDLPSTVAEAFLCACQLLVEFSSLPMYCTDYQQVLQTSFKTEPSFPGWLRLLMTCACFVDNFCIQTAAVSTMIDLIGLTQSVLNLCDSESATPPVAVPEGQRSRSNSEGTVSVVIIPAISPKHLQMLNKQTSFYKAVAMNLWNCLSESTPACHTRAVELLDHLHQLAPETWICENVIGNGLLSDDKAVKVEAYKRFTILWHLLRDRGSTSSPGKTIRTFDRSMFLMLDSLHLDTHPCRSLTQTWLTHSVQRGDIARILEPILLILLHPDTARISIQHVSIHQPKRVRIASDISDDPLDEAETKIYAISSEGGNVIYHVSNTPKAPPSASKENRTFAMTSISEAGHRAKTAKTKMETELHFEKVSASDLNVRVNPFGSASSADRVVFEGYEIPPSQKFHLQNVKRLDAETCKKEGIFFTEDQDGTDESDLTMEVRDEAERTDDEKSTEEIVAEIIAEMINKVLSEKEVEEEEEVKEEESKRGEEAVDGGSEQLLNSIEGRMSEIDESDEEREEAPSIHPLHTHILLYGQKFDAQRTLYALSCLKTLLTATPRLATCAIATTNVSSAQTVHATQVQHLLLRHRRSVFGKSFFSEFPAEALSTFRSTMFIEVLLSLCLYFIRSYYPNLMMSKLTESELNGNKEVQVLSCEVLTLLLQELVNLGKDSGRGFATYIHDLLAKCKIQKTLLHCVLASVYNARKKTPSPSESNFTEAVISFNEENMDGDTNDTFQVKLLKLLLVVIHLEDILMKVRGDSESLAHLPAEMEHTRAAALVPTLAKVRYFNNRPVVYQSMLLTAVLSALKQQHRSHMHRHWIATLTSALPYLGRGLSHMVVTVVNQICRNMELLSHQYDTGAMHSGGNYQPDKVPPDHVITLLEGLTTLCHYCLLDSMAQQDQPSVVNPVVEARRHLLSILPRILSALCVLWHSVQTSEHKKGSLGEDQPSWTMGPPRQVRQYILEFISPISRYHSINLMGAMAVVWNNRRQRGAFYNPKRVIPSAGDDQLLLVELISAIKVFPTDTLIQTVKQVIHNPPTTASEKVTPPSHPPLFALSHTLSSQKRTSHEVGLLQFFFAYVQRTPGAHLVDSWPSLLSLLKEGLQINLSPPGHFILLALLSEFVQKIPMFDDRKDLKDLQDILQKLLESVGEIAGASLEQTTFFRRNLVVKPGAQIDVQPEAEEAQTDHDTEGLQYSVQALVIIAELTATLLDVVYRSEEKDRVVPLLHNLMYNVFPYLKNHSPHNLPSFRACAQLLANLSEYQYTRKAWKKEAFELLLDSSFFQTDETCIGFWRTIIDNLMTHDKTTFRDLLGRVTITQGASLNLFTSKEHEIELRAQLLKRLSFTVFCSDLDQYQRSMPEIQERLSDSLRLQSVPSVQAQVFLCFRVLIMRVSPHHLTSLWPTIITELVQVLLQIEQELSPEMEDSRTRVAQIANLDPSWALQGNGVHQHQPGWLRLYLAACKLLDLALVLPADLLPQFQLYRWAFIGDTYEADDTGRRFKDQVPFFTPHITRIAKLLNARVSSNHTTLRSISLLIF
ncbi:hypothetical protein CAPTEDRAFT_134195 [Capitella teleta]|uniref:Uncharacterized protein n=1 Tax=Capitella teleta TaxID=283909 RepID=R7VE65_CAPTE|nr:hypothetical protein CAPTEDRAFT_134195 [Capitella teleta]|eukprot:ELU14591.1 hypothetical protein CAPTEDRAFT_134195 [Capitella teleta]